MRAAFEDRTQPEGALPARSVDLLFPRLELEGGPRKALAPETEIREASAERAGGGEWILEIDGQEAGKGGILFHYNIPPGDIYMEIAEPFKKPVSSWSAILLSALLRKKNVFRGGAGEGV